MKITPKRNIENAGEAHTAFLESGFPFPKNFLLTDDHYIFNMTSRDLDYWPSLEHQPPLLKTIDLHAHQGPLALDLYQDFIFADLWTPMNWYLPPTKANLSKATPSDPKAILRNSRLSDISAAFFLKLGCALSNVGENFIREMNNEHGLGLRSFVMKLSCGDIFESLVQVCGIFLHVLSMTSFN